METNNQAPACPYCNNLFDSHRSRVMLSCGDTICDSCLSFSITHSKGQALLCTLCGQQIVISQRALSNLGKRNERTPQGCIVKCDKHSEQDVAYFCTKHQTLICLQCAFDSHHDHKRELIDIRNHLLDTSLINSMLGLDKARTEIEKIGFRLQNVVQN